MKLKNLLATLTLTAIFLFVGKVGWGQAKIIISEVTDASAYAAEYVEIYNAGDAAQDLIDWKLQQYGASQSIVFSSTITTNMTGNYTLNPGEYVIVCRGTLAEFQTSYPGYSGYYFTTNSSSSGAPSINGDEYFELYNTVPTIVDRMGSTTSIMLKNKTYERNDALSAGTDLATDWTNFANTAGTPGAANATVLANDNSSSGGSNDADSKVNSTGVTQPAATNISSLVDTKVEAIPVFQFNIADLGTTDGKATEVTGITIKAGANNTANWTNDLAGGYLYKEGVGELSITTPPVVTANSVKFFIDDAELDIADGGSQLVTLYVYLNTNTTDNAIIECMVDANANGFTADGTVGSTFATDFGANVVGNQFTIDVNATKLSFTTQPKNVEINTVSSAVVVSATDANDNIDVDYAATPITLSFSGTGVMGGTNPVSTASGQATFSDLTFDKEEAGVTISAAGAFTSAVSDVFSVVVPVLFFSEYIEGGSNNKAVEIYNPSASAVDLSGYIVKLGANGGAWSSPEYLTGTLAAGDVYIIVNDGSNAAILAKKDIESTITYFNGNDAVGLFFNDKLIDAIGVQGVDPGTEWDVAGINGGTLNHTIIRKSTVTAGNTDWTVSAGTNETDSEWEVFPQDYTGGLGSHNLPPLSIENNITGFDVTGQVGDEVINTTAHTVNIGVTSATVLTALEPVVTVSAGATVSPLSGVAQNFTTSKTYTVTAEGGNSQAWNVAIVNYSNIASLSDLKVDGTTVTDFASTTYDYIVALPYGTTVTPTVTVTENSSATSVITPATDITSETAADRTTTIAVTSQDKTVNQNYTVLFNVTPASTDANVTSATYTVNSTDNTITAVPSTETLATFKGNITPAAGASFEVYLANGTTVATDLATGYKLICTAQDGSTKKAYTITLNTEPNHEANITAFSILGINGTINAVDHTIAVTVPYGTTVTSLVATFTLSSAATAKIGTTAQVSGVTANNFTNPVVYIVTAEDALVTVNWTVTVTEEAPSTIATVTSTVYTVNSTDNTITNVPYNETLATFESNLVPATGATFDTYLADGTIVATDLATGYKVIVTAQNGSTKSTYTITLTAAPATDLFFSEYIEGASSNKALEIYNPKDVEVNLSDYLLKGTSNDATDWENEYPFPAGAVIPAKGVYVISDDQANPAILAVANWISTGYECGFNGNDARGLFKKDGGNTVLIDMIGTPNNPSQVNYDVAGVTGATVDHTLVRKDAVTIGNTDWAASAGTDANNSEWIVKTQDDFTYIGWHISKSSAKDILSFILAEAYSEAEINTTNHTISISVINGTNLTALVPTITISNFATISPTSGVAQDFTNPVEYTVTAQDGTTQVWTVTVTVSTTVSAEKDITSFSIPNQTSANIDAVAGTVVVVMPFGTNATSLTPTIAISAGATIDPASGVAQDFTNPVQYTVTAQDASTKVWTVTVTIPDVDLISIHDIQYTTATGGDSPLKGQQVRTKGVVTAVKTGTNSYNMWLQDGTQAWNGIYVYGVDNANTAVVGDSVELLASVDEYFNLTELKTITSFTNLGAGTLPAAVAIGIADAKTEAYEGMLAKITNVECTVVDAGNGMFTVSDGTNTMNIDDFIYKYTPTQGTRYNITGVIDYSYNEFKVLPRDANDVVVSTSATVNPFATFVAYPNPFNNEIRFNGSDIARVTITSIIGQVVMDKVVIEENRINTQELAQGIYLVKFTNKKGESTLRKLIKE